ncbi:MAG: Ig-like domain-containing protein, partial [Balneolales bacterium]|nr:Ig-like domain-containing protein [Balneolales bacterium]
MNSIFKYSCSSTLFVVIALSTFLTGCKDNLVGVEGFCPVVESTSPINLATDVNPNTIITVTFEEKINPDTMIPSAFSLSSPVVAPKLLLSSANNSSQADRNSVEPLSPGVAAKILPLSVSDAEKSVSSVTGEISGSMSFNNTTNTMTFTPSEPLDPNTVYTGRISNTIEDPLGNRMLEDYVWSFTTAEAPIVPVPSVVSTTPQDEDIDVPVDADVTATFSEAMNQTTLDETTFTLFDGTTQIDGSVSYTNLIATFNPNGNLSSETTYTATITTGAQNVAGIALGTSYEWEFTTEEVVVPPPPLLGVAETFGIMATSAITNTGNTIINGDVALDPGTSLTGFPPGIINGVLNINNTQSAAARADLLESYNYFKGLPPGTTVSAGADLGAIYPNGIAPGTYTSGSTMLVSTTLVLDADGDTNAVWVFQIGSSLTTGADVTLLNGANENNVYWVMT